MGHPYMVLGELQGTCNIIRALVDAIRGSHITTLQRLRVKLGTNKVCLRRNHRLLNVFYELQACVHLLHTFLVKGLGLAA